jgi:flagellar biosynthetic protein FlhB
MAIPFLLLALAAVGGNIVQHRLVWSAESLKPKLSKVSPAAGLKRLFSKQALANFVKGLVKLGLIGTVMVTLLWPERFRLDSLVATDPIAVLPLTLSLSLKVLGVVIAVLALIAAADYLFQYRQWYERQKMSLRELKDEFKQTEGDPAVKGKIRQIRQTRMRQRVMTAVPKASVVITNPTHFAVALQYERGMTAPICVAKGADLIARKIREIATEHGIPIVENPAEHYQAVAEVIGYVMRLNRSIAR